VVIATPHALHTPQAIDALKANKAVFVEKPAAVTTEQLQQLETCLTTNSYYCVDFNRSFAPFILKIKAAIVTHSTPLMITYRMNAGFLPKDHWIQSEQHGGRIIGEACHIFELFSFLTDAQPTTISASPINFNRSDLLQSDNFSTTITYDDGSVCTLLYTALGHEELAKEHLEIFFDGKSIVMDDYKMLHGYGLPKSFNQTMRQPDKGHANLISQFFAAVAQNKPSPLPISRILTATKLSIQINNLITGKTE
jgi:Predicted dehydrogenases and related proteins